jgi:hypothetical protein
MLLKMKQRSKIFTPGQRVFDTMLAIIDSVNPLNWREIRCRCDCGKETIVPYWQVYNGTRYSCGCRRRVSYRESDQTGETVSNSRGNHNYGRSIVVLGRDHATQQWEYLCSCCAETFLVPRGNRQGMGQVLKEIARSVCPNFRKYVPWELINGLTSELKLNTRKISGGKDIIAEFLARYYKPQHVERQADGKVLGLWGLPDYPLPGEVLLKRQRSAASGVVPPDVVPIDADNFSEFEELVKAGSE